MESMADGIIESTTAKLDALRLRLPRLHGKEHKRQRVAVKKELYAIENGEAYAAALSAAIRGQRAAADATESEAWKVMLQRERDEAAAAGQQQQQRRRATENLSVPERLHFRSVVAGMFDEYAPTFEEELVGKLHYRTPGILERALARTLATGDLGAVLSSSLFVDLGCGTGLAAVALQARCTGRLLGCDLSRRMVAVAANKRRTAGGPLYDELHTCDAVACLRNSVALESADLIVAADVLVYMRELDDLFRAAEERLSPGGLFGFSTEIATPDEVVPPPGGPGWIERPSERIAHAEAYWRQLMADRGILEVISVEAADIRNDMSAPIQGHIVVARKRRAVPSYRRAEESGEGWQEHFLNVEQANTVPTCAESVAHGHSVIVIDALATAAEVEQLKEEAVSKDERIRRADSLRSVRPGEHRWTPQTSGTPDQASSTVGRTRMPIADMLGASGVATCDALLLRALSQLDATMPLLTPALFPHGSCSPTCAPCLSPTSCVHNPRLVFSTGEPAINVYTQGGGFQAHQDKQSLTILVNLSIPGGELEGGEFEGGGTAFWDVTAACDPRTGRGHLRGEPTMALCPPAGSALVFGGTVTHAGQPVLSGRRCVFVASFSPASDEADTAAAATATATTARHSPAASGAVEAVSRGSALEHEQWQIKQQRLRDQRKAYEARVEAERARQLALQGSFHVSSALPHTTRDISDE